jgi:hypothetical protein
LTAQKTNGNWRLAQIDAGYLPERVQRARALTGDATIANDAAHVHCAAGARVVRRTSITAAMTELPQRVAPALQPGFELVAARR